MFQIVFGLYASNEKPRILQVAAETLGEVETIALLECRRRLKKRFIMILHIHDLNYIVQHGLDTVGKFKIRSL